MSYHSGAHCSVRPRQVVNRLDQVSPEVLEFFHPAAQVVMASADPLGAMAAALATLSGITERPKPRSLLTQVRLLKLLP